MSWDQNKRSWRRLALAAVLVTTAGSAAANVLVVRSAGPSAGTYPAGRSLPDDARIALREGDMVVVLGANGTRTFRGPGTFSPTGPVQAGAQVAATSGTRRARIGAVRNAGVVPRSPTIWHVDVSHSGKVCLADADNVMLWRPDATETVTLTITPASGPARTLEWPAGETTAAWPSGLRVAADTEYRLSWPGAPEPTRLTFAPLSTPPTDVQGVAEALIANGCQTQLDVLVETVPTETPAG